MAENRNQKKINTASAREMGQTASSSALTPKEALSVALFGVLLFAAMTVQTGRMSLVLCGTAVVSGVLCAVGLLRRQGEERPPLLALPVIGLLLYSLVLGAAAIYTPFGGSAPAEFNKALAAVSLAVIVLSWFRKRHVSRLLWVLAAISAVIAVISVDGACFGPLFDGFAHLTDSLGGNISTVVQDDLTRQVAGIYNDANVTATLFALGTLLSLHLSVVSRSVKARLFAALLLGVNALTFLLSMSRGAILCFAVVLVLWLVMAPANLRLSLFLHMAFSGGATLALSIPASSLIIAGNSLADVLLLINGGVIVVLCWLLVAPVTKAVSGHKALALGLSVSLVVCAAAYCVAAVAVTGSYTMNSSCIVMRKIQMAPGEYTMTSQVPEEWNVLVYSQTRGQRLLDQLDTIFESRSGETSFEVSADADTVLLMVSAPQGTVIDSVDFSGGIHIELGHPLMPTFAETRLLNGMGSSFLTRAQFDIDAWKLFCARPLLGYGLGSTENMYRSVQTFPYESVYVHNHLLQVMTDTGLVGTAFALTFMLGIGWLCLREVLRRRDGLCALFLACWAMMNLHGLMEISFSVRGFRCFAYCLLMLAVLYTADGCLMARRLPDGRRKQACAAVVGCFALYLAAFGWVVESHRMVQRESEEFSVSSYGAYFAKMESFIKRDKLAPEDSMLNYVANAVERGDTTYMAKAEGYARTLRKGGVYEDCSGLARYYYLPLEQWEDLFAVSREGLQQVASSPDGWNLQLNFYRTEVLPAMGAENMPAFLEGVAALMDALNAQNEKMLEPLTLSEENETFLKLVDAVIREKLEPAAAFLVLNQGA